MNPTQNPNPINLDPDAEVDASLPPRNHRAVHIDALGDIHVAIKLEQAPDLRTYPIHLPADHPGVAL